MGAPAAVIPCGACPFESHSRSKILHHRQFHRPRGLAFKCPRCSYNVTRRHLLAQHIKVHGLPPDTMEQIFGPNGMNASLSGLTVRERSDSPSPSLTITPIKANGISDEKQNDSSSSSLNIADFLPILSESATEVLSDIPLVWTSKDGKFFKLYKCRFCPHINMRKTNVQDHEKMHATHHDNIPRSDDSIKCPYCSYRSMNVNVIATHVKVHEGLLGKIHALVDTSKTDDEQIHRLKSQATMQSLLFKASEANRPKMPVDEDKLIYCCQHCPARFFFEKEVLIHSRFHGAKFNMTFTCDQCNYSVRQKPHLLAHVKVHSPEYKENTRSLLAQYRNSPTYPPVPNLSTPSDSILSPDGSKKDTSIAVKDAAGVTRFKCSLCPSTFSKQITLQYHQSLHGANHPHRCNRCTYAAKTPDALAQHISLHEKTDKEDLQQFDLVKSQQIITNTIAPDLHLPGTITDDVSQIPQPPIKMKIVGLKGQTTNIKSSSAGGTLAAPRKQFKYYVEEQVPLSGVDLLRHKTQMEQQQLPKNDLDDSNSALSIKPTNKSACKASKEEKLEARRNGDPSMNYPLYVDKSSGKAREKRYKCKTCPSAFDKLDQYNVHINLHGSNQKYQCRICDYSVKFFANFNMHINRHKYNERFEQKKNGTQMPDADDSRYDPIIRDKSSTTSSSREPSLPPSEPVNDLTTAEKQHLLIQEKKGIEPKQKEDEKDRRVFYCQYCPYASMRRDGVDSHSLRHTPNGGKGLYRCNFCNYMASQPNFIREHNKVHFRPFKYVVPEGFIRHDQQEIFSMELITEDQPDPVKKEKAVIFSHKNGNFKPYLRKKCDDTEDEFSYVDNEVAMEDISELMKCADPVEESGVVIDFASGDAVQAPASLIITIKPGKSKHKDMTFLTDNNGVSGDIDSNGDHNINSSHFDEPMEVEMQNGGPEEESVVNGTKTKDPAYFLGFELECAASEGAINEQKQQSAQV